MEKVLLPRGMGKSRQLVVMSSNNNIPIAVAYNSNARYLKTLAKEMGLEIPDPIVLKDTSVGRGRDTEVYLDDAEYVFRSLFDSMYSGLHLSGFSMSTDE